MMTHVLSLPVLLALCQLTSGAGLLYCSGYEEDDQVYTDYHQGDDQQMPVLRGLRLWGEGSEGGREGGRKS